MVAASLVRDLLYVIDREVLEWPIQILWFHGGITPQIFPKQISLPDKNVIGGLLLLAD